MKIGQKIDCFIPYFVGFILISILFLPDIQLPSIPGIQIVDICIPFIVLILFIKRNRIKWSSYFTFILLFAVYVLITIFINDRLGSVRDYFELYKFFKYLAILLLVLLLDTSLFLQKWITPLFISLVVVNMLHYFDIFNFNHFLERYYDGGLNISFFGKDTLGNPATKRMAGIIGNPNNNAVLFSFFAIYFFPFFFERKKLIWFLIALLMVFLCQSKTTFLVLGAFFIAIFIFRLVTWTLKQWFIFSGSILIMLFFSWTSSSNGFETGVYTETIFTGDVVETNSAKGRLEIWSYLGEMILNKPVFGHGPNKDFFYENKIYSENEYVLYAWRYGFIGLFCYLLIYLIPFIQTRSKENPASKYMIMIVALMLTTALTNNPFTERNILIIFAFSIGVLLNISNQHKLKGIST